MQPNPRTLSPHHPKHPKHNKVLRWTLLSIVPEVMIIIITARAEMCVFIQPFKGGDDRDFIQTSDQLVVFIAAGWIKSTTTQSIFFKLGRFMSI